MDSATIGRIVRYLRKKNQLSQKNLADIAGVGKTVVFDIEKGKPSVQFDSLVKVFAILNIELQLKTPIKLPNEDSI